MASRRKKKSRKITAAVSAAEYRDDIAVAVLDEGLLALPSTAAGTRFWLPEDMVAWFDQNPEATKRNVTDRFGCNRDTAKTLLTLCRESRSSSHAEAVRIPEGAAGFKSLGASEFIDEDEDLAEEPGLTESETTLSEESDESSAIDTDDAESSETGEPTEIVVYSFKELSAQLAASR